MEDYSTLMNRRIRRILLVCNNYDSFVLEEDGNMETLIANEYAELNLISTPPAIVRAETTVDALALLEAGQRFDLVITMYNVGELDVFSFSHKAKAIDASMPIVLLTAFSREIRRQVADKDRSCIDYVFCWNNSTDLLIAIIKLLEDSLNAEHDILECDVQAILLVEDSIRYYSSYLPALYTLIFHQNNSSIKDALNERQQVIRKRSRPKVLMATNYDDAISLYERYKRNLLGVISDVGFVLHKGDKSEDEKIDAGVILCKRIKEDNPKMPILMQSSQESMRPVAEKLGAGFILKSSKLLMMELAAYIEREFCFGDFVVFDRKTGEEKDRASNLSDLERIVRNMSATDLQAIAKHNYFSKWMFARGLFDLGREISQMDIGPSGDIDAARKACADCIHSYRIKEGSGAVSRFQPESFNDAIWFSRLGNGSMGGKGRGLAFLNHILQKHNLYNEWEGVHVLVPRTLVVTTEYFDKFIVANGLQYVIDSDSSDEEILSEFVASTLPLDLVESLRTFIRIAHKPLAVRSSSVLEDSYYQPFAGVYSTYMIPHTENEDQELRLLTKAIKSVYASVFFASSKGYITASGNVISEEKMGIIIEEVCGSEEDGLYFPTLSGVARSLNFYPVGNEEAEDGIVKLAYGLGKAVVEGEQVLRFSPNYPKHVMQTSTPELVMTETQKSMFALNLSPESFKTSVDDSVNFECIRISDCGRFASFRKVVSTWDEANGRMVDSPWPEGPKFVTFAPMLKFGTFPIAQITRRLLDIMREETRCDIEIEFAAEIPADGGTATFNVLQVRPISTDSRRSDVDWNSISTEGALLTAESALGTGWINDVKDVVYLKKESFDRLHTVEMAEEISKLNAQFRTAGTGYVLIGYGRWGSAIPSLGVPVKWSDISSVEVLVECSLEDFRVDPSQGTHFFQNLTSFNVGYINVDPFARDGDSFDYEALQAMPAVFETKYLRHVRFEQPLSICIDGRENRAVILK